MDTRDGTIYDNRELAKLAGVPDGDLVTGSRDALEKLRTKLVFTKGSFKSAESQQAAGAVDPHVGGTASRPRATKSTSITTSCASATAQKGQ